MPRGRLSKIDIEPRIYKLKTNLYNGHYGDKSDEWRDGYHAALNSVLDILQEFSSWPKMTEEDFKELQKRALKMKNDVLMEEPCPIYEADEDEWEDFWYNEDK